LREMDVNGLWFLFGFWLVVMVWWLVSVKP
jgi:hypothetical protein